MLSEELLKQARTRLFAEKKRIEEELGRGGKRVGADGKEKFETAWKEIGTSEEENALEVAEYSDTLGIHRALEDELSQIEAALLRIEQKTYGICGSCRLPIPQQRLMVRPHAQY
jgi:RNA polymerase-binding transcription factor DksA